MQFDIFQSIELLDQLSRDFHNCFYTCIFKQETSWFWVTYEGRKADIQFTKLMIFRDEYIFNNNIKDTKIERFSKINNTIVPTRHQLNYSKRKKRDIALEHPA